MKTLTVLTLLIVVAAAFFIGFEIGKASNAVPIEHARALSLLIMVKDATGSPSQPSRKSELYPNEATEPGDWSPPPMMTVVKWSDPGPESIRVSMGRWSCPGRYTLKFDEVGIPYCE
jgi:hypothetical protein